MVLRIYVQAGEDVGKTISLTGVSESSLYGWIKKWNEEQSEKKSLLNYQGSGGGRLAKVDACVWTSFRAYLAKQEQKHFRQGELRDMFSKFTGGVSYSSHYFSGLLRKTLKLYYYKPQSLVIIGSLTLLSNNY